MHNKPPPKYIINPLTLPIVWTGNSWAYHAVKNPNWLNSAWLGTGMHLLCYPQRVWNEILAPLLRGNLGHVLFALAIHIPYTLALIAAGLFGWLRMLPYQREVIQSAFIMNEEQARQAIEAGNTAPIIAVADIP